MIIMIIKCKSLILESQCTWISTNSSSSDHKYAYIIFWNTCFDIFGGDLKSWSRCEWENVHQECQKEYHNPCWPVHTLFLILIKSKSYNINWSISININNKYNVSKSLIDKNLTNSIKLN